MKYNKPTTTSFFDKELKRLSKKHPSLGKDIQGVVDNLEKELMSSTDLGNGFHKLRINIKSKNKGKRGGGRIIVYETIITVESKDVVFVLLYDKSEFTTVDVAKLKQFLSYLI